MKCTYGQVFLFHFFSIFILYRENPLKNTISLIRQNSKFIKFDNYFAVFSIIIIFMIILINYSTKVYPYISSNLGGGYYKYNTLVLDNGEKITGKIIHSNNKFIYIIEEENKLSQYFIDQIKSYAINDDYENTIQIDSTSETIEDDLDYRTNAIKLNIYNTESVEH